MSKMLRSDVKYYIYDQTKAEFRDWFISYCDWCWNNSVADCLVCKKRKEEIEKAFDEYDAVLRGGNHVV